ncbi:MULTISPECIES: DEAD/DEAH box helicase [Cupriavidus]
MFGSLFGKTNKDSDPTAHEAPAIDVTADGIFYQSPVDSADAWLASPFSYPGRQDLGARLAQLQQEGLGRSDGSAFLLPWADLYALLRHPELSLYREPLGLPPDSPARPRLNSIGAISDSDFSIVLDGWVDPQGRPLLPAPKLIGRCLQAGGDLTLLPPAIHALLDELKRFHSTPGAERTQAFKEQVFSNVRRLAATSGSPVSDYVSRTIVLAPEHLRLALARRGQGETSVTEVIPDFDDAPTQWLDAFDRLPLQDSYNIPDGASLVRIVLTAEVKSVLGEVKRMPGRLVAGRRAEAFVRNPFALLGEGAHEVLDSDEFEQSLKQAGIRFKRFTPQAVRGDSGQVTGVALLIEELGEAATPASDATTLSFHTPDELARFTGKLGRCIDDGSQCVTWGAHELEILGESTADLATLETWLHQWRQPALWTAAEVLDLSNYSERIEDIGAEKPVIVPVIARHDEGGGWFEHNAVAGLQIDGGDHREPMILPLEFSEIPSLQAAVAAAEARGASELKLPGLADPVPVVDARRAVDALLAAQAALKRAEFDPTGGDSSGAAKKRLLIKHNFDVLDYNEARADRLQMPDGRHPDLPQSLRPDVALKAHQMAGIAWLQHLWNASPHHCRGAVLADDMGLGKTLQLLTFITSCFERDPTLPPALVVAPVALLENWRSELSRFFAPEIPALTLYGDALRALRVSRHELDEELRAQGVTRLLKRDWIGDARLVLTTYETMRDLEFALASQQWSILVCDEAQKIKNPSALVTRSAKKQKVRFRIACTGTPVENTLADLWCLFDFVQPGMLGALSQFSRDYRQPIEAKTDAQKAKVEELRALIQPQILHRRKTEVARDLPAPVEDTMCKQLPMSGYQHGLYEGALAVLREQRDTNPSAQLQALHAIRQICSDPHGFAESGTRDITIERLVNESPKMGWLIARLKALAADRNGNHKVIVFCEFRELQLLLQRVIAAFFGFAPDIVNGDTSADPRVAQNRQRLIDRFQEQPGFHAIILSPLAVGFGVNIQAANHVIHFTRTWNPAKEDQATARAYRIGQTRTVTVYYPGVISERFPSFDVRLDGLLGRKRELAADMLNGCSDLRAVDFADFG